MVVLRRMLLSLVIAFAAAAAGLYAFTLWQVRRIEAANPPRGAFVEAGGGRLHYTRRSPGGAPRASVLLIHGASGSEADMMEPLGDALAARDFDVIAIDRPGHGWSDRLGADTPARQASLIADAMKALGVTRFIAAGHSLGAVTAVNLAIDHADSTAGLVLIAPVTHPWPGGVISWYYKPATMPLIGPVFVNLFATPAGLALMDLTLAAVFAPQTPPADYVTRTGAERVLRPHNFEANARDVAGIFDFVTGQTPRMAAIKMPTAIVTGDSDSIVLTHIHSYGSARDIAGATLRVLPGVGHSPHWADPRAVADAVESVAARIEAEPVR